MHMKTPWMIAALLTTAGCATTSTDRLNLPPLRTVERVDLKRYLGTWYEIASIPQRFQKGCTGTTATYSLRPDGQIDVLNKCRLDSLDGREKIAHGTARVVDVLSNARLEVSFFGPFWGDYWVIELDPDYQYAVVGHPSRDYLWILSRTPQLDPAVYAEIRERLRAAGYDLSRVQPTLQPAPAPQVLRGP
ncbi:MAG: Lipocalin family protein [Myxococcaceae bacterium]|nr:Lipocalin family protein [Myxococcaceae bacterium]